MPFAVMHRGGEHCRLTQAYRVADAFGPRSRFERESRGTGKFRAGGSASGHQDPGIALESAIWPDGSECTDRESGLGPLAAAEHGGRAILQTNRSGSPAQ